MLKIRLRRMGARNNPFYRVVVSDSRRVPTGRAVEEIGFYDPTTEPVTLKVDSERVQYWVGQGAQLSPTVAKLVSQGAPVEAPAEEAAAAEQG